MFHKHDQVENFVAVVEIKFNPEALAEMLKRTHKLVQLSPHSQFALLNKDVPTQRMLEYFKKYYEQTLKPYIQMCARSGVVDGPDSILFMGNKGTLLVNKTVDENGYNKAIIYDELGMASVTHLLNQLQSTDDSVLDLQGRFKLLLTDHQYWYMSTMLSKLISEGGDVKTVNKLKDMSIDQFGYLLCEKPFAHQELVTAVNYWIDQGHPNAVRDFLTEFQTKAQQVVNKFKSKNQENI